MSNYGLYGNMQQFDFDTVKLASLGFSEQEINNLQYIITNGGKVTTNALMQYGYSYEQAKRLRYMYEICLGKVVIDDTNALVKHLRKMNANMPRIGIQNLKVSTVNKVPRKAVVAGIKDPTYKIYNSGNHAVNDRMYDVVDVTSSNIHIKTSRKPVLKYGQSKQIDGVLKIIGVDSNKRVTVAFDKKYCKLCNRFVIIASLRRPEYHLGLIEIICIEGTRVYVYASNIGSKETVSYSMGTQRVYDYGYYPSDILPKLRNVGAGLYRALNGVYSNLIVGNQEFRILTIEDNDGDDIEIED